MGRRAFITSSLAAVSAATVATAADEGTAADKRQVYALHIYQFASAAMVQRADAYFQNAMIPALRRIKTGPVGVMVEMPKADAPPAPTSYYVLIPLNSISEAGTLPGALDADEEHARAGEAFLKASPKDPGYTDLEVRLMIAPAFMPKLEVPQKNETRLFELRRYRSPSEPAFRKKLEMFGKGGELALFRRVGLVPVFYGEMLCGPDMPNITYMLTYPDAAAKPAAWKTFRGDAEWKKLSTTPGYTDAEIIANIKSVMLKPTAYSEI